MLNQKLLQDPEVKSIAIELLKWNTGGYEDSTLEAAFNHFKEKHTKPPVILKTEDGVEVTDGGAILFGIYGEFGLCKCVAVRHEESNAFKFFSTPEARDEYILWNKPCLSGNDVNEYLRFRTLGPTDTFTALLKSKIK